MIIGIKISTCENDDPKYHIWNRSEGLLKAMDIKNRLFGYIDEDNNEIVKCKYKWIGSFK
jgi:hypothetical protein